ncbi:MAG: FMN-binding protein, partial [Clostridiales bacterium]|nr:FMN-binding protein [Clostridiales bacterium]
CDVCGEYPCACSESTIKAGTYTVYDTGRNGGMLSATVTVDATGKIVGLELTLPNESPSIGQPKGEELKANILAAGHTNVDVISTATLTSLGILRAVNKALVQAGVIQEPD